MRERVNADHKLNPPPAPHAASQPKAKRIKRSDTLLGFFECRLQFIQSGTVLIHITMYQLSLVGVAIDREDASSRVSQYHLHRGHHSSYIRHLTCILHSGRVQSLCADRVSKAASTPRSPPHTTQFTRASHARAVHAANKLHLPASAELPILWKRPSGCAMLQYRNRLGRSIRRASMYGCRVSRRKSPHAELWSPHAESPADSPTLLIDAA